MRKPIVSLALIAAALLGSGGVARASHDFSDVPNSAFYHDFVDFLVQNGLTSGCGPGLFCGDNAVTRGQLAVFLDRLAVLGGCAPDAVRVGPACVDRYEASVWRTQNGSLIQKIRLGTATAADLQAAAATPLGLAAGDLAGAGCPLTGNGCVDVYAVSIPGVTPSRFISWLQASAAARNAGKRLPTNAEWQAAALGTPPGAPCKIEVGGAGPSATGTAGCVSDAGAFDLVGNLWEWVAEWAPTFNACGNDVFGTGDADLCLAQAAISLGPGTLARGGGYVGADGVLRVQGVSGPSDAASFIGFRGVR